MEKKLRTACVPRDAGQKLLARYHHHLHQPVRLHGKTLQQVFGSYQFLGTQGLIFQEDLPQEFSRGYDLYIQQLVNENKFLKVQNQQFLDKLVVVK